MRSANVWDMTEGKSVDCQFQGKMMNITEVNIGVES
jgi:hypothetical protein